VAHGQEAISAEKIKESIAPFYKALPKRDVELINHYVVPFVRSEQSYVYAGAWSAVKAESKWELQNLIPMVVSLPHEKTAAQGYLVISSYGPEQSGDANKSSPFIPILTRMDVWLLGNESPRVVPMEFLSSSGVSITSLIPGPPSTDIYKTLAEAVNAAKKFDDINILMRNRAQTRMLGTRSQTAKEKK
jgi:hypothetical protein